MKTSVQDVTSADLSKNKEGQLADDAIKTEKGLELQAELPFVKKQQLKHVQELKMEIENQLRACHTSTPKPGGT